MPAAQAGCCDCLTHAIGGSYQGTMWWLHQALSDLGLLLGECDVENVVTEADRVVFVFGIIRQMFNLAFLGSGY
jgi:hypothetical protein